jgi:predicted ATPase
LTQLLRAPATRLVTLLGPGGVGKTRLATEVAWTLRDAFADGVRFVELAGVGDAGHLASSIAQALDVPALGEGDERAALLRFIATRELLIVLDNFEQLAAASPLVGDLLAWCPRVTVLATSREPLRLSAEHVFRVAPLAVPGDATALPVADLERFGATAMFVERARARDRAFSVAPEEVRDVLAICRRLDGLPLALELAAARLGVLSVGQLAARLSRSLAALGAGVRDAPERHSTLRSTIDWSVELLDEAERQAFVRFAVFAGGATVEAAEAVIGAPLDILDSLVAKQLIVRTRDRLTMLETTREYAAERLEADPGAAEVRDRHLRWCLGLAEEHAPELVTRRRGEALAILNRDIDNLRAALAWSIGAGRGALAVALAGALGPYWWRANHDDEGRQWLDAALRVGAEAPAAVRARALLFRARVSRRLHGPEEARDLCDAAELFAEVGDRAGVARCLAFLAVAERSHGEYDRARAHIDEAVRTAREVGDPEALATALTAAAMRAPDFASASALAEEAIAALQAVGNVVDVCSVCSETGYLAIRDGRYADALPWLEQALIAAREAGDPLGLHLVDGNQALALLFCGKHEEAAELFARSLELCRDFGFHDFADESLFGLAAVAVEEGRLERAARLAGAARAHGGGPNTMDEDVVFQRLHEQYLVPGRSRLGEPQWDRAMLAGGALSFDDAVDLALERQA